MQPTEINAVILKQIDNTFMHRFVDKNKALFTSGLCKVAKIQNPNQNTVYFININSFYYTLNKSVIFAKIDYGETVSYLFPHFDNGLSSITIMNNPEVVQGFEEILSNAATLLDFKVAMENPDFKKNVDENCPNVENQPIYVFDNVKKIIKNTGRFLGEAFKVVGGYVSQGVQIAGNYLDEKIEEPAQKEPVKPETKQKWETIKKGTSQVLTMSTQFFNNYLKPALNAGVQYGKKLGAKVEESDNPTVKYGRQILGTSGQALNQAFNGLYEGATSIGKQVGDQSKKIVNKKFGEDYVKTFLDDGPKKEQGDGPKKEQNTLKQQQSLETIKPQDLHEQSKPLYPYLEENKN